MIIGSIFHYLFTIFSVIKPFSFETNAAYKLFVVTLYLSMQFIFVEFGNSLLK